MAKSDRELIEACRRGDGQAWQMVLDQYERLVFSIPLNSGLSAEDAADVTQLTFTIFMESLDRLRDDSNLAAWLSTVAKRHSWRVIRQRRRESPETDRRRHRLSELAARQDDIRANRPDLLMFLLGCQRNCRGPPSLGQLDQR